jgi:hypothetical protein
MAITFRGSVCSFPICGNNQTTQTLFAFDNDYASRVNCYIRRLVLQNDALQANVVVMPLIKSSRITTNFTGGILLPKATFDTLQTSDTNVKIWASIAAGTPMVATALPPAWEEFGFRLHTQVEKVLAEDSLLLPDTVALSGKEYKLRPGQTLLVQLTAAAAANNPDISNNWWVQAMWEEDSLPVFNISGQVTLASAPVTGARVLVIEADDESMSNPRLVEVKTTDNGGNWSSSIRSGMVGAAFVQYTTGGIYYTAPGSPFLEH